MTRKNYTSEGIDVSFDGSRCLHFAECIRGLGSVFDTGKRPWIQPANAAPDDVAEVIRRCPSGALRYHRHVDGPEAEEQPHVPTDVIPLADGPLVLDGDLRIHTPAGDVDERRASLCACTKTGNAPYCDGTCDFTRVPGLLET
ncbi:hypothetical protein GCM10027169_36420 [Gordonia jinhuaensis]|uniref:Fe-S cluster protein YjdI n=1 Tax=Gordonia jinhuaensis TaxID=1517702 RepID=A0A916WTS7_9ACTN|nr:(4Fe-4S)-binding protein [Gordonia jinhuaensis]GGB29272.1 hypothetical protein GCM10011489_16720 [Gordonia jinhuaensis]